MVGPSQSVYAWGAGVFAVAIISATVFFIDLGLTGVKPHLFAWYSSAAFVFLSFAISMATIWEHFVNYRNPRAQRYVVRIVVLVPLYSTSCWLSLRFHEFAFFFGAARDCYEAYVIFCFFAFLLAVQGGEERLNLRFSRQPHRKLPHPLPMTWLGLRPWSLGASSSISAMSSGSSGGSSACCCFFCGNNSNSSSHGHHSYSGWLSLCADAGCVEGGNSHHTPGTSPFLLHCQAGVLQYVILKLALTFVSFGLEPFDLFGEGEFTHKKAWVYISSATNLSQMWAMYCLVRFYSVCANDLRPVRPVGKLLAVKSVVFFTYSQSCLIAALHYLEFLPDFIEEGGQHWSTEDVSRGLQDYLICIEMLIAAIVFSYVFSHRDYKEDLYEELEQHSPTALLLNASSTSSSSSSSSSSMAMGYDTVSARDKINSLLSVFKSAPGPTKSNATTSRSSNSSGGSSGSTRSTRDSRRSSSGGSHNYYNNNISSNSGSGVVPSKGHKAKESSADLFSQDQNHAAVEGASSSTSSGGALAHRGAERLHSGGNYISGSTTSRSYENSRRSRSGENGTGTSSSSGVYKDSSDYSDESSVESDGSAFRSDEPPPVVTMPTAGARDNSSFLTSNRTRTHSRGERPL